MTRSQASLTEGSIWKGMLLFALPIFLGNVFQQFYNTFDSWVVGHYLGDTALAAVSSSGSLIFLLVGFFNGVAMGAGVVIARFFGARDYEAVSRAIHTDVGLGLITGVLLTVIGVGFTPAILRMMNTPADVLPQSISYFRYYFLGATFTVMYNIFVGILHALGDSKHPLYYLIISTFVNVILDLVFVGWMGLGVGSAALATTISQGLSAALCCIHLMRLKGPGQLQLKKITVSKAPMVSILRQGLPSGVQNSMISIANIVVQTNINGFGSAAMAGCGTYSKIEGFAFLPVTCFSMALSTFVSQNLGAGNKRRVRQGIGFGIGCAALMAETVGVLCYLFAPRMIALFNDSPSVVDFGTRHMRTICLFYCLLAFSHCAAAVLRGAGKAAVPMYVMLICWCIIRVSYITLALTVNYRLETVSWAYPITWTLSTIVFTLFLAKGSWLKNAPETV